LPREVHAPWDIAKKKREKKEDIFCSRKKKKAPSLNYGVEKRNTLDSRVHLPLIYRSAEGDRFDCGAMRKKKKESRL